MKIWKWPLVDKWGWQTIEGNIRNVLQVNPDGKGHTCLYATVGSEIRNVQIGIFATGCDIKQIANMRFLNTLTDSEGIVFHFFVAE